MTNTERVVTHITYLVMFLTQRFRASSTVSGVISTDHLTARLASRRVSATYQPITGLARGEMFLAELLRTNLTRFNDLDTVIATTAIT
jgi:hypothetical protein